MADPNRYIGSIVASTIAPHAFRLVATRGNRATDECRQCEIWEACVLFRDLSPEEVTVYQRLRHLHAFQPKQALYHEGLPALGFYVPCAGRVKLSRADPHGRQQILRIVDPGGVCGVESLLPDACYTATAEALEQSQAAFIKRDQLLHLLREVPRVALTLLGHISRMLAETEIRLAQVALGNVRTRLGALLVDLAERYGEEDETGAIMVRTPLTRAEMAAMVGMSPETAMRTLAEFVSEGLVRTAGRDLIIQQMDRLRTMA